MPGPAGDQAFAGLSWPDVTLSATGFRYRATPLRFAEGGEAGRRSLAA